TRFASRPTRNSRLFLSHSFSPNSHTTSTFHSIDCPPTSATTWPFASAGDTHPLSQSRTARQRAPHRSSNFVPRHVVAACFASAVHPIFNPGTNLHITRPRSGHLHGQSKRFGWKYTCYWGIAKLVLHTLSSLYTLDCVNRTCCTLFSPNPIVFPAVDIEHRV
ncbi:hypothetical protein BC834DRAFT_981817, partial [Gloeopeniophorella convolvens]